MSGYSNIVESVSGPRVVDASRPVVRVELAVAEAAELLMSLGTAFTDHGAENFDVGAERIDELRRSISPDLLEQAKETFDGENVAAQLLGLVYETAAPRTVADFLAHLEAIEPLELQLTVLGYYARGHHIAEPETIRSAALGDAAARDALLAAAGQWAEKCQRIEWVLDIGRETIKSRLVDVLARWNTEVFEPTLDEVRPLLERDVEEKRALAASLDPGTFTERATGGIQYTPPPEIRELVFFPSYWFRPWVLMSEHKHARIFGYPIASPGPAVELPDLARLYKALGDERRLALLRLLRQGPVALGAAAKEVELSKSTTHHHLAILRQAGLVLIRNDEENSYSLRTDRLAEVGRLLDFRL